MPETAPIVRKLLLIPEDVNGEAVRAQAEAALSNLPVQKIDLGDLKPQGGKPVRQLTIELTGTDNSEHNMALRKAVDLALESRDLTQYSPVSMVRSQRA